MKNKNFFLLLALVLLSFLALFLSFAVYGQTSPAPPASQPASGVSAGTIAAISAACTAVIGGLTGLMKLAWDILKEFKSLVASGIPVIMDPEKNKPFLEEQDKRRAKQCEAIHKGNSVNHQAPPPSGGVGAVAGALVLGLGLALSGCTPAQQKVGVDLATCIARDVAPPLVRCVQSVSLAEQQKALCPQAKP